MCEYTIDEGWFLAYMYVMWMTDIHVYVGVIERFSRDRLYILCHSTNSA